MSIGDGIEPTILDDMVKIPHGLAIPWEGESSIQKLYKKPFPNCNFIHGMHLIWFREPY